MSRRTFLRAGLRAISLGIAIGLAAQSAHAQSFTAPGLRAPGSITYDAEGVPVIQASNDYDVAFLQGYAHARDRYFQMDFNRRGASGTVAELVGPAGLANDVQIRTLGLRRAAFATWQAMGDETRGWLKAYADGVNFYRANNPLPPEYGALELTSVPPWSPVDSIVIGKALAFQLSFDLDIDYTIKLGAYQQAGAAAGFNGAALFFEDTHRVQPPDGRVSIPAFSPSGAAAMQDVAGAKSTTQVVGEVSSELVELACAYRAKIASHPLIGPTLEQREERGASNWWLVSPGKSATGKALIANDPHLALDTPSIFYEAHIVSTDARYPNPLNATGASVPGTPGIIQGCTERFCWGSTVNPMDVTDTYQEQFVLNTYGLPTHTIFRGVQEPVVTVLQVFNVNPLDGVANNVRQDTSIGYLNGAVTVLVPRRNFGPVVQISGSTGLSVQYTGWGATFELESFRRINRARTLAEFRDALTYFDVGSQNFGYADVDGNIAYFTSAEMPIREDLQTINGVDGAPPFIIRDGTGAKKNEWLRASAPSQPNQTLPFDILKLGEMPNVSNPAAGYIANANNDPIGTTLDNNPFNQLRPGGGLYYLNPGYSSYRIGRIDRVMQALVARGNVTVAELRSLQANNELLDAELVAPHLINALNRGLANGAWPQLAALANNAAVDEAVKRIEDWNYSTPTGIRQGFDPGDNPANLPEPSNTDVRYAIAATLWATWRGQAVRAVVDGTLTRVGLTAQTPGSQESYTALKFMLDNFATRRGVGASGLNFFQVTGAPTPEDARDFILLKSMQDALNLLASEGFSAAFGRSTNQNDYLWGKLHRIVFDHPLGGPFDLPGQGLYGFTNFSSALPGIPRSGGFEAVDASSHNSRANSVNGFMFTSGPARRFLGDMSNPIAAQMILPGGQRAVLGDPLYASQLGRWLTNNYKPLNVTVASAIASPAATLNFTPP
jgi:penicillin amidase